MYILSLNYCILVIITICIGGMFLKKLAVIFCVLFLFMLCSCVRTGQKDSMDFLSSMIKNGYDLHIEETVSSEKLKESCFVDGCKLSLYSDSQGRLVNITVTYAGAESSGFDKLARAAVKSFCDFEQEQINDVFNTLGIYDPLSSDTNGVRRCDTEWYGFGFTSDEAGGTLAVVSYRLEPASVPDVTLNTTVPFLSKKSSS